MADLPDFAPGGRVRVGSDSPSGVDDCPVRRSLSRIIFDRAASLLIIEETLIGQIGDFQIPQFVSFYETGRQGDMLNCAAADLFQNLPDRHADRSFRLFQNDPVAT